MTPDMSVNCDAFGQTDEQEKNIQFLLQKQTALITIKLLIYRFRGQVIRASTKVIESVIHAVEPH